MATRPLFLHVGTRKSGTTSLQDALKSSRPALRREGVNHPFNSRPSHMKRVLAPLLKVAEGDGEQGREELRELTRSLAKGPGDRLLVTLEDLAEQPDALAAALLSALSESFEVHVVITARDWSKQIPSEWQQLVKSRETTSYEDYAAAVRDQRPEVEMFRRRQHLPDIARRWSQGLPPEHVHVVAVPSFRADPTGLYDLFADLVGYDPAVLEVPSSTRNVSLGYEQAELLRQVNLALGDRLADVRGEYRPVVRRLLINGPLRDQEGRSLALPPGHVEWVADHSRAALEELRAAGHDLVGDPEDLVPPPGTRTMDASVGTDVVAQIAVQSLADVMVRASNERLQAQLVRDDGPAPRPPQDDRRARGPVPPPVARTAPPVTVRARGAVRRTARSARRVVRGVRRRLAARRG